MPGFTAINACMKEAQRTTLEALPVTTEGDGTRTKASGQRHSSRKHHTRVGESTQAVNDIVPGDSANKRISSQGKKIYGRVSDQPATKRTKRGDVDMNMHIAKFGAQTTQKVDSEERSSFKSTASSSKDAAGMSLSSKAKLDSFRDNYMRSSGDSDKLMGGPGPISLHAPQTSMNTLQRLQPQTTMQAVQSSAFGSSVLYSSSDSHLLASSSNVTDGVPMAPPPSTYSGRNLKAEDCGAMTPAANPSSCDKYTIEHANSVLQPERSLLLRTNSEDFGCPIDESDDDSVELVKRVNKLEMLRKSPSPRERRLNIRDVDENEDYDGALFTVEERRLLDSIKPAKQGPRPIVRTSFPTPILDRTSLFGATNASTLRTCFRLGEALNTGCQAVRGNHKAVLEIYARVTSSWRDTKPSRKQHFIFNDLYHDKPPFLNGTYELWNQSPLWDQDSSPFLNAESAGMKCRMIARMKRDGRKWRLEILSIWEADWDDINHVAGIYSTQPSIERS
ncbi:hypothetical protein WHR41_05210 [Cladosporium halotolerans]|uniref:Uncharacterized protein n=1 Tax=Cladosporium halotolerans TaxID=1052096 RepID=A0AB34KRN0_9PEZI